MKSIVYNPSKRYCIRFWCRMRIATLRTGWLSATGGLLHPVLVPDADCNMAYLLESAELPALHPVLVPDADCNVYHSMIELMQDIVSGS